MLTKVIQKIFIILLYINLAIASQSNWQQNPSASELIPAAPQINSKAYILLDINSDQILGEKNSQEKLAPASLTKVMSMYIVSSALKNKQITMDDSVHVSTKAWKSEGARMFIKQGSDVKLSEIINGIIIASGNDATVAIAEHIAGSEEAFAELMNATASQLGMHNSHFVNATGMPHKNHYSTAADLAILAKAIIKDFPELYHLYKQKWFKYNNIKQPNRNRLLWRNNKVDGLKTGHTDEAGYCLIASAKDGEMRLVNVQLGAPSDSARTNNTQSLLTWGMRFFETKLVQNKLQEADQLRVWGGKYKNTPLGVMDDLYVTIAKGKAAQIKTTTQLLDNAVAPIKTGTQYGNLAVSINNKTLKTLPLHTLAENEKGSIVRRVNDQVARLWKKYLG